MTLNGQKVTKNERSVTDGYLLFAMQLVLNIGVKGSISKIKDTSCVSLGLSTHLV